MELSIPIVIALLLGVLLLPLLGAALARVLGPRFGVRAARLLGAGGFAASVLCLLTLSRVPIETAGLGRFAIFLPSSDVVVARDSLIELPTPLPVATRPPATPRPSATVRPSATPTSAPTPTAERPTPTLAPTLTTAPPPTEAPPPPTEAPPAPTDAPPQPQRYVVEPGDTLRGIAARFDVSVDALLRYNGLSAEEGDSLRVGQELFIPPQ